MPSKRGSFIDISNPFRAALVFLSHSWSDNKEADYIFRKINKSFRVWYDRGSIGNAIYEPDKNLPTLGIGEIVLPRDSIGYSDFVLFLASEASMNSKTVAAHELNIASLLSISRNDNIGLVELFPYKIPIEYRDLKFEIFSMKNKEDDAERIIASIKKRLTYIGGLSPVPGRTASLIYATNDEISRFREVISDRKGRGIYSLNAIPRAVEREKLVRGLLSLSAGERNEITDNLIAIYMNDNPTMTLVRQGAIYILSRLNQGNLPLSEEVQRRYPAEEEPFLYRGFHISLGYMGSIESIRDYVSNLSSNHSSFWSAQKKLNSDFHSVYYGSRAGAIRELKDTIKRLQPNCLLELNVFTLGDISNDKNDIQFIEDHRKRLVNAGVSNKVIQSAINLIKRK
jgi:hypothetical protein